MSEPTTHHLTTPTGTLHYEVRGSGPLLLVIGQPMTSGPFGPLADLLATDHTVVTYDPHGLGESTVDDHGAAVTPEVEADDLARILGVLGADSADVFGSSGGAVAGLALATLRPDLVRTLIAHEPPVTELLPDGPYVRVAIDDAADAYRAHGSGAAWGKFVSIVMHRGPVTEAGIRPATWSPPESDGAAAPGSGEPAEPPQPSAKQQADDELFFLRMIQPFTRYRPEVEVLRAGRPRIVVAVGAASGAELARRSAEALADQLGAPPVVFPGDHGGFMADPVAFGQAIRDVLAVDR